VTGRGLTQPFVFDVNDAVEFSLWLSPHVLTNIERVLESPASEGGFEWEPQFIEEYLEVLVEISKGSNGGVVDPAEAVTDCPDYEDNRILELALACQAAIIVSNERDLLHMSQWRGIPVLSPRAFAARVDAVRRARRR
jgi:putative PIN family toxin of toxin-antitoxin system